MRADAWSACSAAAANAIAASARRWRPSRKRHADAVIVTDDNPRGEDGDAIVADILAGFADPQTVVVQRDRAMAIARAIGQAGAQRHRADRRQGPRALSGNRRRAACVRRHAGRQSGAGGQGMKPMPLSRIAQWTGGRLHGDDVLIDALSIDTRTLDASDGRAALFVALKGERFDGHDHVADGGRSRRTRRARVRGGRSGAAAGRGRRHRARAGRLRRGIAAHAPDQGHRHHRQQRQDQRQDAGAVDPAARGRTRGWRRLRQSRQPQQRDRPAAGGDRRARRCAITPSTKWAPASPATSPISPTSSAPMSRW